jgi:hypothetical protein
VVAWRITTALVGAAVLAGCHQYLDPRLYSQVRGSLPELPSRDKLEVRFLSVQGFVVRYGDVAVMMPPLYSNPPLDAVIGQTPLRHRNELIDQYLEEEWTRDVHAILVGHSHYDHLMDVPYISGTYLPNATIYGSRTAGFLLEAMGVDRSRIGVLNQANDDAVDYRQCAAPPREGCVHKAADWPGRWVTVAGGRMRFRALCSRHSPQFARLPVTSPGCLDCLPPHAPRTADEWKLGDTFAYLIDFLDADGQVAFRVYYQDSPTEPTFGYVHPELIADHRVDVALLCAGGFNQVDANPKGILFNTRPRYALFGHWELFFEPLTKQLKTLFAFKFDALRRRLEAAQKEAKDPWKGEFWFPTPGGLFVFERQG